ncbi:MAG TPA: 30S ribosomal protein S27e [Candidatus Thermoplasmatota archaeon]|nr:30S ribosomal protein S27e [Candidatus Thermoplasmatota archaeon]
MPRQTTSKFVKAKCPDCSNEQVVFNKPAMVVNCLVCGAVLAEPAGGLGKFRAELVGEVQ